MDDRSNQDPEGSGGKNEQSETEREPDSLDDVIEGASSLDESQTMARSEPDFDELRAAMKPALAYEDMRAAIKPALDFEAMRASVIKPALDFEAMRASVIKPALDFEAMRASVIKPALDFEAMRASVIKPVLNFDAIRAAIKPALDFEAMRASVIKPVLNFDAIGAAIKPALDFKAMRASVVKPALNFDAIGAAIKPALDFEAIRAAMKPALNFDSIGAAIKSTRDFGAIRAAMKPALDFEAMRASVLKPALDFEAMRASVLKPVLDFEAMRASVIKPALNFDSMRAALMPSLDFKAFHAVRKSFPAMMSLGMSLAAISSLPASQYFEWHNPPSEAVLEAINTAAKVFTENREESSSLASLISQLTEAAGDGVSTGDIAATREAIEAELSSVGQSGDVSNLSAATKWCITWLQWLIPVFFAYLAMQNGAREELCFLQPKILPGMTSGQLGKAIRSAACEMPAELLKNYRFVRGESVRLRADPGKKAEVLPVFLSDGALLEVLGSENRDWLHVSVLGQEGVEGWISRKYVRRLVD